MGIERMGIGNPDHRSYRFCTNETEAWIFDRNIAVQIKRNSERISVHLHGGGQGISPVKSVELDFSESPGHEMFPTNPLSESTVHTPPPLNDNSFHDCPTLIKED